MVFARRVGLKLLVAGAFWSWTALSLAQVTPEDHQQHHPGQASADQPPEQTSKDEEIGGMMDGMGAPPAKELYPQLMSFPDLTPAQRTEILNLSDEEMREGIALLSAGVEQLDQASQINDFAAMQAAVNKMHEGLSRFESGLAVKRSLVDGRQPREIAMGWFKREMNLNPSQPAPLHQGILGVSWFHFFLMAALIAFAVATLWIYFQKMRRATQLLLNLTGGPAVNSSAVQKGIISISQPPVTDAGRDVLPSAANSAVVLTPSSRWSGLLRITRIFQETPNVKTFRLMNPLGGVLPFAYLPGQFLTVAVNNDGQTVKRSYTIASSPTQQDYAEITVKHEDSGVVSSFLHNRVREGDLIDVSGPAGSFTFTGRECNCILLIGGGVGITPLMSVLRYLTDRSWTGDIYLLYAVRSPSEIIFREELDYLSRRHPNLRVVITVTTTEGSDWKGPTGYITRELIAQSVPNLGSRYIHICGPVPMMESVKKVLAELGVRPERIKTEAFGLALGKPAPVAPSPIAAVPPSASSSPKRPDYPILTFSLSNKSAPMHPDKSILDVADEIGVEIDNSCRAGTCGVCRVKLLSGNVEMAVVDGLEPGDKQKGIVLACQSKATGDLTVEA